LAEYIGLVGLVFLFWQFDLYIFFGSWAILRQVDCDPF